MQHVSDIGQMKKVEERTLEETEASLERVSFRTGVEYVRERDRGQNRRTGLGFRVYGLGFRFWSWGKKERQNRRTSADYVGERDRG